MSNKIGADNWLYIALDALTRYAEEGGAMSVTSGPAGLRLTLAGVGGTDERLPAAVRRMAIAAPAAAEEPAIQGGG